MARLYDADRRVADWHKVRFVNRQWPTPERGGGRYAAEGGSEQWPDTEQPERNPAAETATQAGFELAKADFLLF